MFVKSYVAALNRKLSHVLNTHHHYDHTGGNLALKEDGVKIFGPASEKIPGIDVALKAGDTIEFGRTTAKVLDVGGHTKGHIAFYFESDGVIFVGDSLFALGCGKMFEGTADQFWTSLIGLRSLPDETVVYWYVELSSLIFLLSREIGAAPMNTPLPMPNLP